MTRFPSSRTWLRWGLLAVGTTLLGLIVFTGQVVAQEVPSDALRIAVAIDNSRSMSEQLGGDLPSDPTGQRQQAVHSLADVLAALERTDEAEGTYGLSVISFGGDARVALPMGPVDPAKVRQYVGPEALDRTDFRPALCLAWISTSDEMPPDLAKCRLTDSEARAALPATSPSVDSRRVVVLLTDGDAVPAAGALANSVAPGSLEGCAVTNDPRTQLAYYCQLADLWSGLSATVPTELWVVGLDIPGQWFPGLEPYWRTVAGCGTAAERPCPQVTRSSDPSSLWLDIISPVGKTDLCGTGPAGATCTLPGALERVVFQITGLPPDAEVSVRPPGENGQPDEDAEEFDEGSGYLRQRSETTQTWEFAGPRRGVWSVLTSVPPSAGTQLRVAATYIQARMELSVSPENPQVKEDVAVRLDLPGSVAIHVPSFESESFVFKAERPGSQGITESVALSETDDSEPSSQYPLLHVTFPEAGDWLLSFGLADPNDSSSILVTLATREVSIAEADGTSTATTTATATATPQVTDPEDVVQPPNSTGAGLSKALVVALSLLLLAGLVAALFAASYRWPNPLVSGRQFPPRMTLGRLYVSIRGRTTTAFKMLPFRRLGKPGLLSLRFIVAGPLVVRSLTPHFTRPPRSRLSAWSRPVVGVIAGWKLPFGQAPTELGDGVAVSRGRSPEAEPGRRIR